MLDLLVDLMVDQLVFLLVDKLAMMMGYYLVASLVRY
jgi:hypothetical protein